MWRPVEDTYALSYSNLNFHKKRDKKLVNITTQQQLDDHILDVRLTRRTVLSKIAAFYDPVGFFEPLKTQMKLHFSRLNGMDWDTEIPEEEQIT